MRHTLLTRCSVPSTARSLGALLLGALLVAPSGCSSRLDRHVERNGPDFAVAFPDPSELLSTDNVSATRQLLATVQLPEQQATYDALLALLERTPRLDTDHLLLLTEAVNTGDGSRLIEESGIHFESDAVTVIVNGRTLKEGDGRFDAVVDAMLLSGAAKLSDLGPETLGALLGRTRSDETLQELARLYLSTCDDGSPQALLQILGGFDGLDGRWSSSRRDEFIVQVLIPGDGLQGDREWVALDSLHFDSGRVAVIVSRVEQLDTLSAERVKRYVELMSFDSGRTEVLAAAADKLEALDARQFKDMLSSLSFDSGRSEALELLLGRLELDSFADVRLIMNLFSFDSGSSEALALLAGERRFQVLPEELVLVCKLSNFDSSRIDDLRTVAPLLEGRLDGQHMSGLLRSFSFDSDRLDALRLFAGRLDELSVDEVGKILSAFTFDSDKTRARKLLERQG